MLKWKTPLTLKPAFCRRNAIKSKKLTNWLNTRLLVEESCSRKLDSSSISASILVDDRQLSRSRRPSMPCRAVAFCSSSNAGPSRSIVNGRWHTGHAGYKTNIEFHVSTGNAWKVTASSKEESRYCLMHSLSKIWRHLDWMASSAMSLHNRQTVASLSSPAENTPALVLLLRTRSGWQAICLIRVSLKQRMILLSACMSCRNLQAEYIGVV